MSLMQMVLQIQDRVIFASLNRMSLMLMFQEAKKWRSTILNYLTLNFKLIYLDIKDTTSILSLSKRLPVG
jgi:hypothetical protein